MIHILYRHTSNTTGIGKNRPTWFSYEKCLDSMIKSIEGNPNTKLHILYDGDSSFLSGNLNIIDFKGGSDWNSYVFAWNYAKNLDINHDDIIFIAENDYMFLPEWPYKVQELFNTYDSLDYVSLYDHPDKYSQNICSYIFVTKTHHWRTTPSTTGSVIFGKHILEEDFDIHTTNPSDHGRFVELYKTKKRTVLSPIPSLSTHCEIEYLTPVIEWEKI